MRADDNIGRRLECILREQFREQFDRLATDDDFPEEIPLSELGLDSMRAIDLLLKVEEVFRVKFPDSMLNAETFHSAATLEAAIRMLVER